MRIQFCDNPECSRPFQINEYHPQTQVDLVAGIIACPHCATQTDAEAQTVFLTHALSRSEEEQTLATRNAS